jgi:uncharacterized RDD family membrane protein YckC
VQQEIFATSPVAPSNGRASAGARGLAYVVDACLAVGLALGVQLALRLGVLPAVGAWQPDSGPLVLDQWTVSFALIVLALRDVPFGASFAKWLLGLRLETADGHPLGARLRILRIPIGLLPLEGMAGERRGRLPWRVASYVPSRRGLLARAALALGAAAWSVSWGVQSLRPSVSWHEAERLARTALAGDPSLERELGLPLEVEVQHIAPRSQLFPHHDAAEFELRITGSRRRQDMRVRLRKVDGVWVLDEAVDVEITALASTGRDTVAAR